jgi:rubrerythrin
MKAKQAWEMLMNYEGILTYAMQMELDGSQFFIDKAKVINNPTGRALFENLAEVEMEHYRFIKEQLDLYKSTKSFDIIQENVELINSSTGNIMEVREKSEHLKETLEQSDIPDLTILRMAYLIERDYAEFYKNAAAGADDESAKKVFEMLAEWEEGHEELFRQEYDKRMKEYMTMPWGG